MILFKKFMSSFLIVFGAGMTGYCSAEGDTALIAVGALVCVCGALLNPFFESEESE